MIKIFHRRNSGFTIIEGVLAVAIFAMIGIVMARFLLSTTQSATQVRRMTRATGLFDMVFEQYNAAAGYNFQALAQLDSTLKPPREFFHTSDNLSFDGMLITTEAMYSADNSSVTVRATLNWTEGGQQKSQTRFKIYLPQNSRPVGADVRVVVLYNGNGLPGLTVSAPSVQGGPVTGTTDALGTALLRGVLPGTNIPVDAASTPGDYDTTPPMPSTQYAYYALESGVYSMSLTSHVVVNAAILNVVSIVGLKPAGQITGRLVNDDDPANVSNMRMHISPSPPAFVYYNGQFRQCGVDISVCEMLTNADGDYTFYNVIPGSVTLLVSGSPGSYPNATTVVYGATNLVHHGYEFDDWGLTNGRPSLQPDIHVRRRGWIRVTPINSMGQPLAQGTTVQLNRPLVPLPHYFENSGFSSRTDATGSVTFYNVVLSTWGSYAFRAELGPPEDPSYYFGVLENWTCPNCLARLTPVQLQMDGEWTFSADLRDEPTNPPENVENIEVKIERMVWGTFLTDLTDASGHFDVPHFSPYFSGTYNGNPAQQTYFQITVSKPSLLINGTATGQTRDRETGLPAPHVTMNKGDGTFVVSDSSGNFSASNFPYYRFGLPASFTCNPGPRTCSPVGNPLPINTSVTKIVLDETNLDGWDLDSAPNGNLVNGQVTSNIIMHVNLTRYRVQGVVRNGQTGNPVGGIIIRDGFTNQHVATSAPDGTYLGWFKVLNHSASYPGRVTITIPEQTVGGTTYPAINGTSIPLPQNINIDPSMPLNWDFAFFSGGGGI